jgi:hypothetical protein
MREDNVYDVCIVGGGPAGNGLLYSLLREEPNDSGSPYDRLEKPDIQDFATRVKMALIEEDDSRYGSGSLFGLNGEATTNSHVTNRLFSTIPPLPKTEERSLTLNALALLTQAAQKEWKDRNLAEYIKGKVERVLIGENSAPHNLLLHNGQTIASRSVVIATGTSEIDIPKLMESADSLYYSSEAFLKKQDSDPLWEKLRTEASAKNPIIFYGLGYRTIWGISRILERCPNLEPESIVIYKKDKEQEIRVSFESINEAKEAQYEFPPEAVSQSGSVYEARGMTHEAKTLALQIYRQELPLVRTANRSDFEEDRQKTPPVVIIVGIGSKRNDVKILQREASIKEGGVNSNLQLLTDQGAVIPRLYGTGAGRGLIPAKAEHQAALLKAGYKPLERECQIPVVSMMLLYAIYPRILWPQIIKDLAEANLSP